jgi:hypothetical protein
MFPQILLTALLVTTPPGKCSVAVSDEIKRPYDDLTPVLLDVDADGKLDRIVPRTYVGPPTRMQHGEDKTREKESHWIAVDLKLANKPRKTFFRFNYGSDWADYWIYALVPCRANKDRRTDLIFYAGDDTSSDTVIFMNTVNGFVIHSREHRDDIYGLAQTKGRRSTRR